MTTDSRSDASVPLLHIPADERHGVTLAAHDAARAVRRLGIDAREVDDAGLDARPGDPVHLHFTDRLWGASPEDAAARIERIADSHPLTVTLHDVPQESDGARRLPRRADAYRLVVSVARGVVVNSEHERALLDEAGIDASRATVIPLPLEPSDGAAFSERFDGRVAILGFFYPGKGHDEIVAALAETDEPDRPGLVSLGGVSPGHEQERDDLIAGARARGVKVEVTGYLSDADLLDACRRVAVPVVAHRHFSASGSLNTWIAAGRRPLVVDSRYAREMSELRPGTVTLVRQEDWRAALVSAFREPAITVLGSDAVLRPSSADAAEALVKFWRSVE